MFIGGDCRQFSKLYWKQSQLFGFYAQSWGFKNTSFRPVLEPPSGKACWRASKLSVAGSLNYMLSSLSVRICIVKYLACALLGRLWGFCGKKSGLWWHVRIDGNHLQNNMYVSFSSLNVLRCELQLTTLPKCMALCFLLASDDKEDTDLPRANNVLWEQNFSRKRN